MRCQLRHGHQKEKLVATVGIEPTTAALPRPQDSETVLYLQSYVALKMMAPQRGHDPRTSALTVRRSTN